MKRLSPQAIHEIELKNYARKLAGLMPIKLRVRECVLCGEQFESAGNRTCGCYTSTT